MQIGSPRHLVFSKIRRDQLLVAQLIRSFYSGGQYRMAFGGIRSNDDHQTGGSLNQSDDQAKISS